MRRIVWLLLVLIALFPSAAGARPPGSAWVSADLPMTPSIHHHHALVPLAAPSTEHPLGTVAIIGRDHTPIESADAEHVIVAYAWDLASRRVLSKKRIGRVETTGGVVSAVRAGEQILVVAAGSDINVESSEVILFTVDEALEVVGRDVLGHGIQPSLAVSERWIVAGFFEQRAPIAPAPHPDVAPLTRALHTVVLDRSTHAIAGARVFQGRQLLLPDPYPRLAMHALAVVDDRVYLSLPGLAEATIVSATLPSLASVKTRTLAGFQIYSGSAPIYPVERSLVVVTPQGWRVLSRELDVVNQVDVSGYLMAWNPRRSSLLVDATGGRSFPWSVVRLDADCEQLVWAWDRPVAMCDGDEDRGEPIRILHSR